MFKQSRSTGLKKESFELVDTSGQVKDNAMSIEKANLGNSVLLVRGKKTK